MKKKEAYNNYISTWFIVLLLLGLVYSCVSCGTSQFYLTKGYIDNNNRVRITGPKTPINLKSGDSVTVLIKSFKPKNKKQ